MFGRPLPHRATLAQEIMHNTVEAIHAHSTGVFRPVDLSYLSYGVAVLGPLERITSLNHLNPEHYGMYIRSDRGRSGVILPQRTGVDTPEEQLATVLRESGIRSQDEAITMYRFQVVYYE
jgi:MEMO1 family protein